MVPCVYQFHQLLYNFILHALPVYTVDLLFKWLPVVPILGNATLTDSVCTELKDVYLVTSCKGDGPGPL